MVDPKVYVIFAITLVIGLLVTFEVRNAINQSNFTATQNTTMTNYDNNFSVGTNIYTLTFLAIGAATILKIIGAI